MKIDDIFPPDGVTILAILIFIATILVAAYLAAILMTIARPRPLHHRRIEVAADVLVFAFLTFSIHRGMIQTLTIFL